MNINSGSGDADDGSQYGGQYSGQYSSEYDGVDNMNGGQYDGDGDGERGDGSNGKNNQAHPSRWNTVTTRLLSLYGKTQVGTAYEQLNDGARAPDLRPKIYNNGTIGFHHGSLIDVPLKSATLGGRLDDAKKWCNDNPKELVLIFHSELVHEAGYNGLSSQVYLEADDDGGGNGGDDDSGGEGGGGGDDAYRYAARDDAYAYADDTGESTRLSTESAVAGSIVLQTGTG